MPLKVASVLWHWQKFVRVIFRQILHLPTFPEDKFLEFLKLVAIVYCPPVLGHNIELLSDVEELTVDAGKPAVIRSIVKLPLRLTYRRSQLRSFIV